MLGKPKNPDQDAWHFLQHPCGFVGCYFWCSEKQEFQIYEFVKRSTRNSIFPSLVYLGPCYTEKDCSFHYQKGKQGGLRESFLNFSSTHHYYRNFIEDLVKIRRLEKRVARQRRVLRRLLEERKEIKRGGLR